MIDKIVERLAQRLREKFGDRVEQVILFGSYARERSLGERVIWTYW
jgi:predicted nucleotidyltransferase